MNSLEDQILHALFDKPNQTAEELAFALNSEKSSVRSLLTHGLKGKVTQNSSYEWSLSNSRTASHDIGSKQALESADTALARLCNYYLACIGNENPKISTPVMPDETSDTGVDYFESSVIPESREDLLDDEATKQLLNRQRSNRGRYGLFFGYPVSISSTIDRNSKSKMLSLEPLILLPVELDTETRLPYVEIDFPVVNLTAIRNCANLENDEVSKEIADLERDLGLSEAGRNVKIDDAAMRLQNIRPDWNWNEDIEPETLGNLSTPLSELHKQGIFNRAVVMMVERSNITIGLEQELQDLAKLSESDYVDTVLGNLLRGEIHSRDSFTNDTPLLEVLPMNSEQRQAVQAGLTQRLTVVTGPPGTGKSQVATNLMVNAALKQKRVLFASKNNKAVDVLVKRVKDLTTRPVLLRSGALQYRRKLAECLIEILNATTTIEDQENFNAVKLKHESLINEYHRLNMEHQNLIKVRNRVDMLEQKAESARTELGQTLFMTATTIDNKGVSDLTKRLNELNFKADINNANFVERLFWGIAKKSRFKELSEGISKVKTLFDIMHTNIPTVNGDQEDVKTVYAACKAIDRKLKMINELVVPYQDELSKLQTLRTLEELTQDQIKILDEIAQNSLELWKLWVQLLPSTLSAKQKRELSKFRSLLSMITNNDHGGVSQREINYKFEELLKNVLSLLPCWAVTSLSVRRGIPFSPKIFDLVIIDEASQCDIASALPLLYRAKSAVIIGDPRQLTHITQLSYQRSHHFWKRWGITENSFDKFLEWNYSDNSLFDFCHNQIEGNQIVHLLDHHRSHADIINFSNDEFYSSRLRVATSYSTLRSPNLLSKGVHWYNVEGYVNRPSTGGAVNNKEALEIIKYLRKLVNKGFSGSIGVVTPFRAQANLIEKEVNKDENLSLELNNRNFLADTVHRFQGDERDVIFFSPVVSKNFPEKSLGFLHSKNLFNVAITRARAKLLVVGDRKACETSSLELLSNFAQYVGKLTDQVEEKTEPNRRSLGKKYPSVSNPENVSDWEHIFYEAAYQAGIRMIPQHTIEKYVVDFLLIDGKRKLVIEIDGETYHRNYTGDLCRRDQLRNIRLFELGYDVIRFWVYEVRDELDSCLNKLKEWKAQSSS